MNSDWKRIAGIHAEEDGAVAAVWLGLDPMTDTITLYDCCKFNAEVMAVIAEGMNARGRWIPIAWEASSKDFTETLLSRGCNTLHDGAKESPQMAEMASRDIWERMRTGRFKVDRRLAEWLKEFEVFQKIEGKIPVGAYPLMAATRHAVSQLAYAKRLQTRKDKSTNYPKLAMI